MAKKFKLEVIWRVKHRLEENLKRELGQILMELTQARHRRRRLEEKSAAERAELDERMMTGIMVNDLLTREAHLQALREMGALAELEIADVLKRLEQVKTRLFEATKERKIMDKLRDRFRRQQAYLLQKEEEKNLAAVALDRYVRRRNEPA